MHDLLPERAGAQRIFDEAELVEGHAYGEVLHKHFTPSVVCAQCNNEWMNGLETTTKPILRPLMLGETTHLDRRDQIVLASWACMKNMVAEYSHPEARATDAADLERMRGKQLPPTRAFVWIGRHEGMRISSRAVQPTDDPPRNGQATTFAVGPIIFHLLTLPDGFPYDGAPIPNGRIATRIRQIYPSSSSFDCPVGKALTDADAFDLGDAMTQVYKRLVERRRTAY